MFIDKNDPFRQRGGRQKLGEALARLVAGRTTPEELVGLPWHDKTMCDFLIARLAARDLELEEHRKTFAVLRKVFGR